MFFFLLPIGHDATWVRRTPLVTYLLIALMVFAFILSHGLRIGRDTIKKEDLKALSQALTDYPCVSLTSLDWRALERKYPRAKGAIRQLKEELAGLKELRQNLCEIQQTPGQHAVDPEKARATVIARIERILQGYSTNLFTRFGYIPARPRLIALFTHVFLHAGLIHLLGNLLFFWLASYALEDVWGRGVFLFLFFTSTIAALLLYSATTNDPNIPLIGASGAIAGLMGAFFYRMGHVKIKVLFVYWVFVRVGATVFEVSARLFLGFWIVKELFNFLTASGNNVAYAAHLGGFAWGLLVAWLIRNTELETRILAPHLERKLIVDEADPLIKEAGQAFSERDYPRARRLIQQYLTRHPSDVDGWLLAFDIARTMPDLDLLRIAVTRLMECVVHGEVEALDKILDHFEELTRLIRPRPSPRALLACAGVLLKRNRSDLMIKFLDWLEDAETLMTPGLALQWIEALIARGEYQRAKEAIAAWRPRLELDPVLFDRLEELQKRLPPTL